MKHAAVVVLLSVGMLYASASTAAPTCSIEIHPRFNLYVISVGGKPFKNKHYVDYDDAALLQRVLVDSGHCVPSQKVAKCGTGARPGDGNKVLLAGGKIASTQPRSTDPAGVTWSSNDCAAP